jgi:Htaa protein
MRTALAAAAFAFAWPATAAAAPATGTATLTVAKLRGVTVSATTPATRKGRAITLPVTAAALSSRAVVDTGGAITLKAGRRSVKLSAPRLELGAPSRLTARLGGKRTTILTLAPNLIELDATSVSLGATRVTLARAIERRLRVKVPRTFGTIRVDATTEVPTTCRLTTAGGQAPDAGATPVKPRPATALTVTGATVTWHVRDSFIRYIASGEGTSVARGATADPPEGDPPLTYAFHFPAAGGWCDPVTGAARLTFSGTVRFSYEDHGIDLRASDPEVELDGPASRVVFTLGGRRQVIETLDVSKATVSSTSTAFTYDRIPAAIPPGAADSVFAGYYLPGDPFGWVSITFTTG